MSCICALFVFTAAPMEMDQVQDRQTILLAEFEKRKKVGYETKKMATR